MRRRLLLLAFGVSVAGVLLGLSTQARAGDNGAGLVQERDTTCLAVDNQGRSWWFSCNIQIVFAPNGAINQHLTGSVVPIGPQAPDSSPLPSHAVMDFAGQPCLQFGDVVATTVVAGVVTPSGKVKLTCKG